MFNIIGDEITYDRRTVAYFIPNLEPSFRGYVESTLFEVTPNCVTEKDHDEAIEANDDEWKQKLEDLESEKDKEIQELEEKIEDIKYERDQADEESYRLKEIIEKTEDGLTLLEIIATKDTEIEEWKEKVRELERQKFELKLPKPRKKRLAIAA